MRYRYVGVALVALLGFTGATRALFLDVPGTVPRGPVAVPSPNGPAPELLLLDTVFPDRPARLLWFAGRPAVPLAEGAVTTDGTGGVVRVDAKLRAHWVSIHTEGREITSAAPADGGGWWLASASGEILRFDRAGHLIRSLPAPYRHSELATAAEERGVWVVRSPDRFGFGWYPAGAKPTLLHLQDDGSVDDSVGPAIIPAHALLTDLANAGWLAVSGDTVWHAPFLRDEIIAYGPRGDTLWVASRGLRWGGRAPRFELVAGKPVIDYAPVNLGIALGPDRRLYVLSVRDSLTTTSRLDVFDRTSGLLVRSADLETVRPTLAADADGRVYVLDASRLLTGVAPRERPAFPDVDLERLGGGRMTSEQLRGTVTLVNFWASWCTPCRTEMPALDSLRRSIDDPGFTFVTIDEDVREADGRAFITELGFDFPVLFGRGRMQARYHYLGLPYTVVLDRDGRIVQRWHGYTGPDQIDAIRAVIAAELARDPSYPAGTELGYSERSTR